MARTAAHGMSAANTRPSAMGDGMLLTWRFLHGRGRFFVVLHGTSGKRAVNGNPMSVVIPVGHRRWSPPLSTAREKTCMGDVRRPQGSRTKANTTRNSKISSPQFPCERNRNEACVPNRKKGQGMKSLAGSRGIPWERVPSGDFAVGESDEEC